MSAHRIRLPGLRQTATTRDAGRTTSTERLRVRHLDCATVRLKGLTRGVRLIAVLVAVVAFGAVSSAASATEPSRILSSPGSLTFVGGGSRYLGIDSIGGGTWTATSTASWLELDNLSGEAGWGTWANADTSGLTDGVHTATITITEDGAINSPQQVPVSVAVGPALNCSAFGGCQFTVGVAGQDPDSQTIDLWVGDELWAGGHGPGWTATTTAPWLTVNPTGTFPYGHSELSLSANTAALPPGVYFGQVSVSLPGAVNSPVRIPVTLTKRLDFGDITVGASRSETLAIANDTQQTLGVSFLKILDGPWEGYRTWYGSGPEGLTISRDQVPGLVLSQGERSLVEVSWAPTGPAPTGGPDFTQVSPPGNGGLISAVTQYGPNGTETGIIEPRPLRNRGGSGPVSFDTTAAVLVGSPAYPSTLRCDADGGARYFLKVLWSAGQYQYHFSPLGGILWGNYGSFHVTGPRAFDLSWTNERTPLAAPRLVFERQPDAQLLVVPSGAVFAHQEVPIYALTRSMPGPQVHTTATSLSAPKSAKVKRATKFTGTVNAVGGRVTLRLSRKIGKKTKYFGSYVAALSGGRYGYSFRPKYKGTWYVQATYGGAADGTDIYKASKSPLRTLKVK